MGDASRVVAVIPTYAPAHQVIALAQSLATQVHHIVISDDASPCTSDPVFRALRGIGNVTLIRHHMNRGIARGLNDGLAAAHEEGVEWLLTVDQDSVVGPDYVRHLVNEADQRLSAGEPLGAIGAERIRDASGEIGYPLRETAFGPITEEVIQTGTLWRVVELSHIGGFDEQLGIDAVDAAACLALRQRGFTVGIASGTHIEHRIGSARTLDIFGRHVMITGHSPQRRTSMLRNRLRLFPAEFRASPRHAVRTLRRVVVNQTVGLAIEGERLAKVRASLRGLRRHGER